MSRSQAWFDALSTQELPSRYRSVAVADSDLGSGPAARLLAVVPDPGNVYPAPVVVRSACWRASGWPTRYARSSSWTVAWPTTSTGRS